jgi:hypothetical protein
MADAEEFNIRALFASTDTSCAWLEPKEGRDIAF